MQDLFKSFINTLTVFRSSASTLDAFELSVLRLLSVEPQTTLTLEQWTGNSTVSLLTALKRLEQKHLIQPIWKRNPDYPPSSNLHRQRLYQLTLQGKMAIASASDAYGTLQTLEDL